MLRELIQNVRTAALIYKCFYANSKTIKVNYCHRYWQPVLPNVNIKHKQQTGQELVGPMQLHPTNNHIAPCYPSALSLYFYLSVSKGLLNLYFCKMSINRIRL